MKWGNRGVRVSLLISAMLCMSVLTLTGCLDKKPVPEDDKSIAAEVVDDHPASSVAPEENSHSSSAEEQRRTSDDDAAEKPVESASSKENEALRASLDGFVAFSQYPELPNGCEITSLAAVLNFYGYWVPKTTLSDTYLEKAPVGQADFHREFVGDPRDSDAYGCYAPVIVDAANNYLSSTGSGMSARVVTEASPADLYSYIDKGTPVIVWATRYLEAGHYSVTWYVDGQALTWYTPEHCLVLVGYDKAAGTVQLADPLEGEIVSYSKDLFEQRYADLGNQAVVIE